MYPNSESVLQEADLFETEVYIQLMTNDETRFFTKIESKRDVSRKRECKRLTPRAFGGLNNLFLSVKMNTFRGRNEYCVA